MKSRNTLSATRMKADLSIRSSSMPYMKQKNSSGSYKKDGKSQTSLPSLDWDFTTPEHEEIDNSTCVVFNISATDSDKKFNSFDCLTFINRICSDNSSHDTSLKFDIDLSGYQWLNDDSDYVLAIVFSLKGNKGNGTSLRRDDSNFIVEFGENGYFNTTDEALTGEYRNISTAVDADLQGQKITLYFDHFSQNLFQDPAFGLKEGHHGSNGDIGLIVGVTIGGFVGIVVVIAIVIVGVVLIKKKGLKYTTVQ
eukprot:TRINITY_DN2205_c0_g2_i3.p1 TRINITY_DN2205_c0_g2~~TRINITY_DN2205_c0_g2_i3.p1  ORF type:complete len:252 (-),score=44.15 TRINITY_DN2205_c0_g2_i3:433-1188(-)